MSAATHVGRVGILAAALGVGVALFGGSGVAWADPSAAGTGPSASDSPADSPAAEPTSAQATAPVRGRAPATRNVRGARTAPETTEQQSPVVPPADLDLPAVADVDLPAAAEVDLSGVVQRESAARRSNEVAGAAAPPAAVASSPTAARATEATEDSIAPTVPAPDATPSAAVAPAPAAALTVPVTTQTVTSLIETATKAVASSQTSTTQAVQPGIGVPPVIANVANRISTVVNSVVSRLVNTFLVNSPFTPRADGPASWLMLAAARRQPLAAATGAVQVSAPTAPTLLVLDGYNVVPTSTKTVTAFTGRFTYWPGMPNMLQGSQQLSLVDPVTKQAVGNFDALVTAGDPTSIGGRYVQLLVTGNEGTNIGTGPGQIPPVGSIISSLSLGLIGLTYTAMPSPSGGKVSVKFSTPFGNIALPVTYDASEGIADGTFDNRPTELGGGFSIAPADPGAEKIVATIGLLPLFNSVQGRQTFGIFDSGGQQVGSFVGDFTTTSDIVSIYTQAIRVIANDGVNVGTKTGQTPPVGTVYNVAYFGSDDVYLLYSSMPQQSGDVISITAKTPLGVFDVPPALFNSFNASTEPPIKSLTGPGGQKFVATSAQLPFGVNGLPPRDVQTQGYQQFDVYDFLGRKIGSVDADVAAQWDGFGVHSKSLLITDVRSGKTGGTPFEVPPVGSVVNFTYFTGGFGLTDTVLQLAGFDLNALSIVTPLAPIPLLPLPLPAWNRPPVEYFNPFLVKL